MASIDLNNTQIAFESKNNNELRKTYWLFKLMNSPKLVKISTGLATWSLKIGLPVEWAIKQTIFGQFCGGTTLNECSATIEHLAKYNTLSVLDYGAEAKEGEAEFDKTMREMIRVIEFASKSDTAPIISVKVTGLCRFELLEKMDKGLSLSDEEKKEYEIATKRLDSICFRAKQLGVGVFIDAEESWIQETVDFLVRLMMERNNKDRVTVYNTFQMYRHDRLAFLKESYEIAQREGYKLGAKLVRGAYMDKERKRAEEMGYPSPIQPNKAATDRDFNEAVKFCIEHQEGIGLCIATHNAQSTLLGTEIMTEKGLPPHQHNILFSQLYGMSDNLTFNIAKAGFQTAKYIPYGPVADVIPYLIRRAEENSSVSGDMSRELSFVDQEVKRRGL